ncbi:hypothetical protein [Herpetosiphon geysericola]|uniref:Tetratricopeptide repeat protein n=1 Tax=Herpetosiphon geysericola TaxID=70996 RepID=A0A0P6YJZ1_9CHLR|nr:hypothetical protein [Herpetosiphon geysericola]KPL85487.1 hypothetical protein SE18_17850 [Herpetosiphon geysericola]
MDLFQAAHQALNQHNYQLAQHHLITLVRANPSHGEAWWLLAQTFDDPQKRQDCLDRAQRNGYQPVAQVIEPESVILPWEQADAWDSPPAPNFSAATVATPTLASTLLPNPTASGAANAFQLPAVLPYPRLNPTDLNHIVKLLNKQPDRSQQIQAVMGMFQCSAEQADLLLQGVVYHHPQLLRPAKIDMSRFVLELISVILGLGLALIGGFLFFNPGTIRRRWPVRLFFIGLLIAVTAGSRMVMLTRNPS